MAETKKATKKKKIAASAKLTIQYYRSAIGFNVHQKLVIKGLGFRKLNSTREVQDTPAIRGMIAMVPHLVRIVE
jgi:large subunit ribosomal protein L30